MKGSSNAGPFRSPSRSHSEAGQAIKTRRPYETDVLHTRPHTARRISSEVAHRGLLLGAVIASVFFSPACTDVCDIPKGDDYTRLPVVENYEYLRNIRVPEGIFTSAKGNIARFGRVLEDADVHESSHAGRDYPEWPPSPWSPVSRGVPTTDRPMSSSSSSSSSGAQRTSSHYSVGQHRPGSSSGALPRLSTVVPVGLLTPPASPMHPTSPSGIPSNYQPLTAEDRRALSSFRLGL